MSKGKKSCTLHAREKGGREHEKLDTGDKTSEKEK